MVVGDIATGTDLVVIGAGPGGYSAAIRAAQEGLDVVLVDKEKIGGTCLNRGCIPAKAFIHASKLFEEAQEWSDVGMEIEFEEVDFSQIKEWKDSIVEELDSGIEGMLEHENIEYKKGEAKFIDSSTVRIEEEHRTDKIEFENAIIATGSTPVEIPGLEFDQEKVISSRELFNLEEVPEELVVVGGGYIGMEAATKFSKFGTEVKIVEARENILPGFDRKIVDKLKEASENYRDEIYTSTEAKEVKHQEDKAVLVAEKEDEEVEIKGDYILVAAGRTAEPGIEALNLEETGVEVENGFIQADNQLKTSDENIFAIGDVIGQPMLAHKAYREGKVAAEVAAGKPSAFDNQYIPKAMYTDPEVATVGLGPEEAREKFEEIKIGRFPFTASGRAKTIRETEGFIRVVAREDGKLVGTQIVGPRASDVIAEATLALEMQAYLDDVANTIHAHPTFPEAFMEACEDALDKSVHSY